MSGLFTRRLTLAEAALYGMALLIGLWLVGFVFYVKAVFQPVATSGVKADVVVVFTGGEKRVAGGLQLLRSQQAERLLISGVRPRTRHTDIARLEPEAALLFQCCVDLDETARNTIGNAAASADWVHKRAARSAILVTSNYHMLRAYAEMRFVLPDVPLFLYPVMPEQLEAENWWQDTANWRLLAHEYLKLMGAHIRHFFLRFWIFS